MTNYANQNIMNCFYFIYNFLNLFNYHWKQKDHGKVTTKEKQKSQYWQNYLFDNIDYFYLNI